MAVRIPLDFEVKDALNTADNLAKQVKDVFNSFSKTNIPGIASILNQMKSAVTTSQKLSAQMKNLASQQIPTEQYIQLTNQLKEAQQYYEKLVDAGNKAGMGALSQYWEEMRTNIEETTSQLEIAENKLQELQAQQATAVDTTRLDQLKAEFEQRRANLEQLKQSGADEETLKQAYEADSAALKAYVEEQSRVNEQTDDMNNQIQSVSAEIETLTENLEGLMSEAAENEDSLHALEAYQEELDNAEDSVNSLRQSIQQMESAGTSHIAGSQTQAYQDLEARLDSVNDRLKVMFVRLRQTAQQNILRPLTQAFKTLDGVVNRLFGMVTRLGSRLFRVFTSAHRPIAKTNRTLSATLKNILGLTIGITSLTALFSKLKGALQEGFSNLVSANVHNLKNTIDDLKASLLTLKNAFAAAFEPIVQTVLPYIQQLVAWVTILVDKFAQLVAAMFGRKTYVKGLNQTADALDKAGAAAKKALAPFDELNILTSPKGSGTGGADTSGMFDEADVTSPIEELANKIKFIAKKLFNPIKKAWDIVKDYVITSWGNALTSVKDTFKAIGRDFLRAWDSEEMQKIFENIFKIVGGIGGIIDNLATKFRIAWSENERGYRILCQIRDLFGLVIGWLNKAVDATKDWAANLDFAPLMDSILGWLESLEPVIDTVMGIFYDFYTMVLLPLGKWVLEKGLPELLEVLTNLNNNIDWESLRADLADLWEHLEPFAEKVGEGLILFIGDLTQKLADFVNSESFTNFLTKVEDWMDNTTPEDIANFANKILDFAAAILVLKGAFTAISAVAGVGKTIVNIGKGLSTFGGGLKSILGATAMGQAVTSMGGLSGMLTMDAATVFGAGTFAEIATYFCTSLIAAIATAWAGFNFGKWLGEKLFPEDAQYYQDFHWFGEGGFFDVNTEDVSGAFELMGQDIWNFFNDLGVAEEDWWSMKVSEPIKTGWDSLTEWFSGTGIGQLIGVFQESTWKEDVKGAFEEMWNQVKTWWDTSALKVWWDESVAPWFTLDRWKELAIGGVYEGLLETWNQFTDWWNNTGFMQWWNDVTQAFSKENWTFSGIWEGLSQAWNTAIENIKNLWNGFAEWLNSKLSIEFGGKEISIGKLPTFSSGGGGSHSFLTGGLLHYASGQVIPPYMSEHLAVLGDNSQETEVVSPLSTMQEAMINALNSVGLGGDGQPINIYLGTDLIYSEIRKMEKRHNLMGG